MKSHNLGTLSREETEDMQLEKRAALLIHQARTGKITRWDITKELNEELDTTKKERLEFYLNKYRKMK